MRSEDIGKIKNARFADERQIIIEQRPAKRVIFTGRNPILKHFLAFPYIYYVVRYKFHQEKGYCFESLMVFFSPGAIHGTSASVYGMPGLSNMSDKGCGGVCLGVDNPIYADTIKELSEKIIRIFWQTSYSTTGPSDLKEWADATLRGDISKVLIPLHKPLFSFGVPDVEFYH